MTPTIFAHLVIGYCMGLAFDSHAAAATYLAIVALLNSNLKPKPPTEKP